MKKRIITICLALAILASLAAGASLAFFTDTENATNTFTTGKVDIKLDETFDPDNAKLLPGANVNKDVYIELEDGSEDAYVWYEWLIPAKLDSIDGSTGLHNALHVNSAGSTWDKYRENKNYWADDQKEALPLEKTWDHDPEVELKSGVGPEGFVGTETIEGIVYNKYVVLYHGVLSNAEGGQKKTSIGMTNVYLDKKVDTDGNNFTMNGEIVWNVQDEINIIVRAYGIQAEGFDDVYAAYKAYNG